MSKTMGVLAIRWCAGCAAFYGSLMLGPAARADSFELYWADAGNGLIPHFGNGRVERASLDGTKRQTIFFDALERPWGIALDPIEGMVYWSDTDQKSIKRANTDGTNVQTLLDWDVAEATPTGLAVDSRRQKLYWVDADLDAVRRSNLDGSNVEDVVVIDVIKDGASLLEGIALDLVNNKVYWSDRGADKIQRANLDGSNLEDFVTNLAEPRGIAIDPIHQQLYYAEANEAGIARINLDGSGHIGLVLADSTPWGIALDPAAGKMYWTETQFLFSRDLPAIKMANLDGSNIETIFGPNDGLDAPRYLALLPEPSSVLLLLMGGILGSHRSRSRASGRLSVLADSGGGP